jgi:hypothetical protein
MRGSTFVRVVAGVLLALVLVGIGAAVYQAGMAQGVAEAGRVPAGAVVPAAGYGWGYGFHPFGFAFGLFGILWFLFVVFVLIGLVRLAFGFGRRGGPGGFGRAWDHRDWDRGRSGAGPVGPSGDDPWADERRRRFEELHRELHAADGPGSQPGGETAVR